MNTISRHYLKSILSSDRMAIGAAGEMLVASALEDAGYAATIAHEKRRGDLVVVTSDGEILFVEVKTARRNVRGRYCFTLVKNGHTDHRQCDFCILLCVLRTGDAVPFVVPVSALEGKRAFNITSYPTEYRGALAQYRQTLKAMRL